MSQQILFAFFLTLLAGLSTGVGSLISLFVHRSNHRFLSVSLGFSAGVMIFVSLVDIWPKAAAALSESYSERTATLITMISFFAGMLLIAVIDKMIPYSDNPHEIKTFQTLKRRHEPKKKLLRTGLYTGLAIGIHNFPEGMATFIAALQDPAFAIPIVVAIAIHNIPEGIAVAVPIYYATGNKKKAFGYSLLSGLSEPVGALLGYLVLMPFLSNTMFGIIFAAVAGIMVFISLDELLPTAREYGEHHLSIYGLVSGMMLMAVSIWMFM